MGFWSAVKRVCRTVRDTVSHAYDAVKEKCAKVWNAFTGKHYTDEAEALYDEMNERYKKAKTEYEDEVRQIGSDIENKINTINAFKKDIYNTKFKSFINIASRLSNVTVKGQPFEELFDDNILKVKNESGVRKQSELILIDFDNMSFIETAGMILTLGFFTRKKAKESLLKVKEEKERVQEEIVRMLAQQAQLNVVSESIDTVVEYFDELIKNYSLLLKRFEYGIQSQRFKHMGQADNVFAYKLDFRLIPIVHIEEFQALFNLSIVLKQMANLGYLNENGEFLEKDNEIAKNLYNKVNSTIAA